MSSSPVALAAHVIAAFLVVVAPILGYRQAHRAGATAPGARLPRYRRLIVRQVLIAAVILAWVFVGGVPAARLGLGAPFSWWWSLGGVALVMGFMGWSALALRRRAGELRDRLSSRAGALLLPTTNEEVRWFVLVCLCGGTVEELSYRGFLFDYARMWVPSVNPLELVLATSICFGIAHVYQGWRGVLATTAAGVLMGGLYVATGNLLLPAVAHVLGNMRAAVIFWTDTRPRA
jgi:membrane protease YdiL (CAAX protease family)